VLVGCVVWGCEECGVRRQVGGVSSGVTGWGGWVAGGKCAPHPTSKKVNCLIVKDFRTWEEHLEERKGRTTTLEPREKKIARKDKTIR